MKETIKDNEGKLEKITGGIETYGYNFKDYCKYDNTRLTFEMAHTDYWTLRCKKCLRAYHKMRKVPYELKNWYDVD